VPVWGISVNDEQIGITGLELDVDTLYPGDVTSVSAVYQITEEDTENRNVTNSASATGFTYHDLVVEDISGTRAENDEPTITFLIETPSILVEKELAFVTPMASVNDVIDYNIIVTNNGNVVLT